MTTKAPLVSIGLPVRNGGRLLDRALWSLRAQTYEAIEIVISDNASDDDTAAIVGRHCRADSRIRADRTGSALPATANFDRVHTAATGNRFMWAAHDDLWQADHVERLVNLLDSHPMAALASGIPVLTSPDGDVVAEYDRLTEIARPNVTDRIEAYVSAHERDGKASLIYGLYRRRVLIAIGPAAFWAADPRRNDFHLVLAALCLGELVVDGGLRFTKTDTPAAPAGAGTVSDRIRRAVASTATAWRWVDAYAGVVDEHAELARPDRARVRRALRRRKVGLINERITRVAEGGRPR